MNESPVPPRRDSSTASAGLRDYTTGNQGTRAMSLIAHRADMLRTDVDMLGGEVQDLHSQTREADLQERTFEKGKQSVAVLLQELTLLRGMGWSDIAEVVGVSVSAVRKWRAGGEAAPQRRLELARLAAFLDLIEAKGVVQEPVTWLEMALPLVPGYLVRPLDLYLDGAMTELLDLAEHRFPMEHVLDRARPGWRKARSDFEVFADVDGQRSLRARTR